MPSDRNKETRDAILSEIKEIKARCMHELNVIENSPWDVPNVRLEQLYHKTLCYIEGLGAEIQNSNTPITLDLNLLTGQFLKEIRQKTIQVEEYTALLSGFIHDTDKEINRLKTLIAIAQEAKSRPQTNPNEIMREHIYKAKEKFNTMKNELHELIHVLFPDSHDVIKETLGQLMAIHLDKTSNGYLPITPEIYQTIVLLKDMKIVTINPYNEMEVKLAY